VPGFPAAALEKSGGCLLAQTLELQRGGVAVEVFLLPVGDLGFVLPPTLIINRPVRIFSAQGSMP